MTRPGWRNVALRAETVQKVEQNLAHRYADRPRKPALGAFIEEMIWPVLEANDVLRKYAPFLEEFGVEQERIYIKDNRLNRIAELTFRNDSWFCNVDNSDNCVHIGFAWALPKVYRVMMARGKRKK